MDDFDTVAHDDLITSATAPSLTSVPGLIDRLQSLLWCIHLSFFLVAYPESLFHG